MIDFQRDKGSCDLLFIVIADIFESNFPLNSVIN